MKRTLYLNPLAVLGALGLSLATAHGQSISHTSDTRMFLIRSASDPFGISVVPGNARYVTSNDLGPVTGLIGDGTLLDWQIFTAVGGTPFTGATVSSGTGLYLDTATCADATAGGPQEWFDVWDASDILTEPADILNGTTPAVGNGPTPLGGNVDISGLESGKFYVLHGNFGNSARVNMTMTGPGQTPIIMPTHFTENPGSNNRMWLMEFTFDNPNGNYYNIAWTVDNNQNNTGRRRAGGIFLDGTLYIDTVEPAWEATYPNVNPVGDTLFFINGETNENSTIYYVVLADGAPAPSSAQVKAGTDASDTPVALSGDFAVEALVQGSEMVSGLTASTSYDVYVVAEDVRGPNLQAAPVLIDVTTTAPDLTPPGWTATYPQVSRTPAGLSGIANIDEAGSAYFVVLTSGAAAPTSAQVKAGTDASDSPAPSGSIAGLFAGVDGSAIVGGLTVGATYDVYFVAEDLGGNLQASPQLVISAPVAAVDQFVTGEFTWGIDPTWSGITGGPYTDPWGDGNNAVFEGGNGLVSVASGTVVNNITFDSNNWLLQGGPLTLAGTTQPVINVNANTPRLENTLAGTQGFRKTGSGVLRMVGTNTFTGGIVIDGGWLGDNGNAPNTASLNDNDITANAGAVGLTCTSGTTTNGGITINDTTLRISNNHGSITVNGPVSGNGGIELNKAGNGNNTLNLLSTANDFTGGVDYTNNRQVELNVNSFADTASPGTGNIRFGLGNPESTSTRNRFALQSGATSPLTLTNRQFEIASANNYLAQIYNNSAEAFTINSDLIVSGTGAKTLELGGTGAGTSTFAGDIGDGGGTLGLTKTGASTWILSGDNTYTGTTTVSAGTLALVGGSQNSAITVNNGGTLGFTIGSPTTSTAAVTLNTGHKVAVTGTPDGTSDYLLMTAGSFSGAPVLDPPVGGYSLEIQGSGTQLVLVAPAPSATLVIDLGAGTVIEGGQFIGSGPTNLPLPSLPVGSILRAITYNNVTLTATDNGSDGNFTSDLTVLLDPTPGAPGGDFSLGITSSGTNQTFGGLGQTLVWSGGNAGVGTSLTETKTNADWAATGDIDLATTGLFLGNAYQGTDWVSPQGGTWSGTITLTYDLVGAGTPYENWAGGALFDGDENGDGVSNGLAFLLGAADPDADALGLLPTVTETAGGLVMTFDMLDSASRGTATLSVEHSSDLGITDAWTTVAVPDTSGGPTDGVTFDVSGSGTLDVEATIGAGQASGGKLFGRLKATE